MPLPSLPRVFNRRIELSEQYAAENYKGLVEFAGKFGTPLASHDDTTVEQAIKDRVAIAEFPTNIPSAEGLHANDIKVMMGAPNLVRGGSHSGNVATAALARAGLVDLMSSDYVPPSLLLAALMLPKEALNYDLPAAMRTVSKTPAEAVGLTDRGEIAIGRRADVIRVHVAPEGAAVRSVWSGGRRVA